MVHSSRPLAIDLFCGLFGWSNGLVETGYHVVGYDIEDMCAVVGAARPEHVELIIQDVLTLHGSEFKDAALIVASPPCQEYSYMAMPWKLAKAKAAAIRADTTGAELERLNRLFNACFRIQKEASIAAGRHIPMVVENVRGAIPWVGRSRWNFGSFHLWGDVPALMPQTFKATKAPGNGHGWKHPDDPRHTPGLDFTRLASRHALEESGLKTIGHTNRRDGASHTRRLTNPAEHDGIKIGGDWFSDPQSTCRRHGSKSPQRKAASAMIAKIPEPLSRHIGAVYWPASAHNPVSQDTDAGCSVAVGV